MACSLLLNGSKTPKIEIPEALRLKKKNPQQALADSPPNFILTALYFRSTFVRRFVCLYSFRPHIFILNDNTIHSLRLGPIGLLFYEVFSRGV